MAGTRFDSGYDAILNVGTDISPQDDLAPAVIAEVAILARGLSARAVDALVRPDHIRELPPVGHERCFSFRKLQRTAESTPPRERRTPTQKVIVGLASHDNRGSWRARVTDSSVSHDRTMARYGCWPPARYHHQSLTKVPVAAESLTTALAVPRVEFDTDADELTIIDGNGSSLRVSVGTDLTSGNLILTAPDGKRLHQPMRIDRGTAGSAETAVEQGVALALAPGLGYLVGRHRGYPDTSREGPRYVDAEAGRTLTAAGYMDQVTVTVAARLDRLPWTPHTYLRDLIHDATVRLGGTHPGVVRARDSDGEIAVDLPNPRSQPSSRWPTAHEARFPGPARGAHRNAFPITRGPNRRDQPRSWG